MNSNLKEEFSLYLINMKASNPVLFVRKIAPNDLVLRIYQKALDMFKKDGEERFKLFYLKISDIE